MYIYFISGLRHFVSNLKNIISQDFKFVRGNSCNLMLTFIPHIYQKLGIYSNNHLNFYLKNIINYDVHLYQIHQDKPQSSQPTVHHWLPGS